ncbi:MAG: class I SAM-dependent methyltransferase [Legionellales bacterium]|nr:class I SAM-dependent methyltransferase [Legionellales bacterium]
MMYGELCTEFYNADKLFAAAEELTFYQELFSKQDKLLEPMCGSGRLLIPLVQQGFTVDGFDASAAMLHSCKQRAQASNVTAFVTENTIDTFEAAILYQGIIIPLGSFQLLYPHQKAYQALTQFYDWLVPAGKLVMDLFIPWDALYEHAEVDASTRKVKLSATDSITLTNQTFVNKFEQYLISKSHYAKYSGDALIQEEYEEMNILWYYRHEMGLMLEKFGFKNIQYRKRFLNGSDHLTFIAEK